MVCDTLERSVQVTAHRLYGYCLMPDHLHVLVSPAESETPVRVLLDRFKSFTTNRYWKLGGSGRLWQASARDRLKRPSESLQTLVAYIVNNPVRAGLVQCWTEWPYTKVFVSI
jgi:REP element-mobilizing transposase RayT